MQGSLARVFSNLFCWAPPKALHEADEDRTSMPEQVLKSNGLNITGPNIEHPIQTSNSSLSAATDIRGTVEAHGSSASLSLWQGHEYGEVKSILRPSLMPGGITTMADSAPQLGLYLPPVLMIPAPPEGCGWGLSPAASADLSSTLASSPRHVASFVGSDRTHGSESSLGTIAAHYPGLRSARPEAHHISTPSSSPKLLSRGGPASPVSTVAAAVLQWHLARPADGHHLPPSSVGSSSQSLLSTSQSCGNLAFAQTFSGYLQPPVPQQGQPRVQRMGGSDLANLSRIVQLCTRGRPLDVAMAELRATRERLQGRGTYSVPASPRASGSFDAIRTAVPTAGIRKNTLMDTGSSNGSK